MTNKFIVFVVFAAVVPASLASSAKRSSDLEAAEKVSLTEWRWAPDIVCKVVRDKAWSIEAAKVKYQEHGDAGDEPFFEAAHIADYPKVQALAAAYSLGDRESVFKAIEAARECKNYAATKPAIENYKNSIPYVKFVKAFHAVTKDTGSATPALNAFKKYNDMVFNEVQKLAKCVCGGGKAIGTCPTKELHGAADLVTKILYSWLSKHE